jgi:hypothetical protein
VNFGRYALRQPGFSNPARAYQGEQSGVIEQEDKLLSRVRPTKLLVGAGKLCRGAGVGAMVWFVDIKIAQPSAGAVSADQFTEHEPHHTAAHSGAIRTRIRKNGVRPVVEEGLVMHSIVWLESDSCSEMNRIYNVEPPRGAALHFRRSCGAQPSRPDAPRGF